MKKYPFIHSFSTVGLKHHGDFDYKLSALCTNFTGESGSGKSMVADLLQLIFVGTNSDNYHSVTKGLETSTPAGMVLPRSGNNQNGIGYVFLNLAMDTNQYLAIGCYIEAASNTVHPFIVQQGYSWDVLTTFSTSLSYHYFLKNDTILSEGDLIEYLSEQSYNCRVFTQVRQYHKILFRNQILPIDLASDPRVLKNYAQIIRSFARGDEFNKNSGPLKDFLFGSDKEKNILNLYNDKVEKLQRDLQDHYANNEQIKLIKAKQESLQKVYHLKQVLDRKREEYLTASVVYWRIRKEHNLQELQENQNQLRLLQLEIYWLEENSLKYQWQQAQQKQDERQQVEADWQDNQKQLEELQSAARHKEDEVTRVEATFLNASTPYQQVQKVREWLNVYGSSVDELKYHQQKQQKLKVEQKILQEFIDYLQEQELLAEFKSSLWAIDGIAAEATYRKDIEVFTRKVEAYKTLQNFSDLQSQDSLAKWALDQRREFTRAEESVLAYFQTFPRYKQIAEKGNRYLPNPEELFTDPLTTEDETEMGFWLNLGGVREYIPWITKQIFNSVDVTRIQAYFDELKQSSDDDLEKTGKQLDKYRQLLEIITGYPEWKNALQLYTKPVHEEQENLITLLLPEQIQFEEFIQIYQNAKIIIQQYDAAKSEWELVIEDKNKTKTAIENTERKINELQAQREKDILEELISYTQDSHQQWTIYQHKVIQWLNNEGIPLQRYEEVANQFPLSSQWYQDLGIRRDRKTANESRIRLTEAEFEISREKLAVAEQKYKQILNKDPQLIPTNLTFSEESEEKEKRDYWEAESAYQQEFNFTLRSYLTTAEQERYRQGYELSILLRAILPETFHKVAIVESDVMQQIQRYLAEINEKNNTIAERKIRMLTEVFDLVREEYDDCLSEVNNIRNYFRGNTNRITGGFRVVLTPHPSKIFPIEWFDYFSRLLDEKLSGQIDAFESLRDKYTLEEIMKEAYLQSGGMHSRVTVKELLNPKSYFDLEFSMKTITGQVNKGSSGQTYMAAALLGIARISVIEKDERKQQRKGVRFMPIDEAQGLGGNYSTLLQIAQEEDYQIVSLSTEIVGDLEDGEQYFYMLNQNPDPDTMLNFTPFFVNKGQIIDPLLPSM